MLCLCATCGISSIPLLGWHLKGPRRVFTILQQICVTLYLILLVISQFSLHSEAKDAFFDVLAPFMTPDKAALTRYLTTALNFGRKILYVEYYFLSLLQSVDVHIMICHSFKYEGFSSPGKVLRVVVVGTLVCLALCGDALAEVFFEVYYQTTVKMSTFQLHHLWRLERGSRAFMLAKVCLIKIVHAIAVFKIGRSVAKKLQGSLDLTKREERSKVYQSLGNFVYIPFLVNLILVGHDVPQFVLIFVQTGRFGCKKGEFQTGDGLLNKCQDSQVANKWYDDEGLLLNISGGFFTLASFSHILGYILLFPKLRKAFSCKRQEQ